LKIADILPSKTVPEVNKKKKQTRARKPTTMTAVVPLTKRARVISDKVEERVEDEDGAHNITPTSSFQISDLVQKASHVLHCRHFCLIGVFRKVLAAVVVADTIKEAQSISSMKLLPMGQMVLREMMEIFTTAVSIMLTRSVQLKDR
jgi:hypothetical protein